jgi:Rps23 Pro-64 3,4-dihydroxylase Tpa1-like proline 4-hydroxylase
MNILSYNYDINNLRINYKLNKKIVINNFLSNKFADFLYKQINQLPQQSWFNCVGFGNVKVEKRWKPQNRKKHLMANELAKKSFCDNNFSYNFKRNMGMRPKEMSKSENILRKIFSSEELYSIIEQITGDRPMKYSQLFLSQYKKGCFLAPHSDINRGKWAFVLNMTKDWKPQYGGVLHFLDDNRENIIDSYVPKFNSLVIFKVPKEGIPHFVSHVVHENKKRFAITGWLI